MGIDFEDDSKTLPTNDEILDVSKLISKMREAQKTVAKLERTLELAKDELKRIAQGHLPEAMKAAGLSEFTTDDGVKIKLKEDLYASISEANKAACFAWLEENNLADVIKRDVSISFGRGEEESSRELVELLDKEGFGRYAVKESVHAGTLKALLREQLAGGVDVPLELFGVFQYKEAVLK
jgi:hypothetical protein